MIKIYKYVTVFIICFVLMLVSYDVFSQSYEIKTKTTVVPTKTPTPTPYISFEDKLWELINDWKYEKDGYTYAKDKNVCDYAEIRRDYNISQTEITHDGFSGDYLYQFGFSYVGENLADNFIFEYGVFNGWLHSPSHKETLDRDYTHSCIKCGGLNNVCVQIFASY